MRECSIRVSRAVKTEAPATRRCSRRGKAELPQGTTGRARPPWDWRGQALLEPSHVINTECDYVNSKHTARGRGA